MDQRLSSAASEQFSSEFEAKGMRETLKGEKNGHTTVENELPRRTRRGIEFHPHHATELPHPASRRYSGRVAYAAELAAHASFQDYHRSYLSFEVIESMNQL